MSNAVTKIQLERAVVGHLIWLCAQRSRVQFPGKLFISLMAEEELSKLEKSLYAKKEQKKATVNFTYAQLVCLQAVLEGLETTPVSYIILNKVFHPITQKIIQ